MRLLVTLAALLKASIKCRVISEILFRIVGRHKKKPWVRNLILAVASISLLGIGRRMRITLVSGLAVRLLFSAARLFSQPTGLSSPLHSTLASMCPQCIQQRTEADWATILFVVSGTYVAKDIAFHPNRVNSSYMNFIASTARRPRDKFDAMKSLLLHEPLPSYVLNNINQASLVGATTNLQFSVLPSQAADVTDSLPIIGFLWREGYRIWFRCFKIYLVVDGVGMVVNKKLSDLTKATSWKKRFIRVVKSACMLTSIIQMGFLVYWGVGFLDRLGIAKPHPLTVMALGSGFYLPLAIVEPSQRMPFGAYATMQVLSPLYTSLVATGILPNIRNVEVLFWVLINWGFTWLIENEGWSVPGFTTTLMKTLFTKNVLC